jgi:hypothetical protein
MSDRLASRSVTLMGGSVNLCTTEFIVNSNSDFNLKPPGVLGAPSPNASRIGRARDCPPSREAACALTRATWRVGLGFELGLGLRVGLGPGFFRVFGSEVGLGLGLGQRIFRFF